MKQLQKLKYLGRVLKVDGKYKTDPNTHRNREKGILKAKQSLEKLKEFVRNKKNRVLNSYVLLIQLYGNER